MKFFKILIPLILVLFPFGQLTKLPLAIPEVNVYLQDWLIGGLVVIWLIWHIWKRVPFNKPPLGQPILLFFTIAALSLLVNLPRLEPNEAGVASLYLLRWLFYAGIYLVVYDISIYHIQWGRRLFGGLVLAGTVTPVFGLFQYFVYPDLSNLVYLGWDPHRYRVFSSFFDPGFLGMILVLTLILIVGSSFSTIGGVMASASASACYPRGGGRYPLFIVYCLLFAICYLALALTYSRSSYLAYLGGIGVIAWIKKAPKFFLAAVLVGILTILVLPRPPGSEGVRLEREESVWGRVKNWQQSLAIFKDNPILGVGFNTYRYVQRERGYLSELGWQQSHAGAGADSSLLFVLATTGILGFLAYAWLLYYILIYHIRNPVVLASITALLVHSWFLNSLFYPWIMLWMWMLLGIKERK